MRSPFEVQIIVDRRADHRDKLLNRERSDQTSPQETTLVGLELLLVFEVAFQRRMGYCTVQADD
jgi:hypothetical protein